LNRKSRVVELAQLNKQLAKLSAQPETKKKE